MTQLKHVYSAEGPIPLFQDEASFEGMRKAGKLAARLLDYLAPYILPGTTTNTLDQLAHAFIRDHGAIPAPLGYKGYPKSICTSINHVVCHGIPNDYPLKEGEILNIDVSVILEGWYGDTSRMFGVGNIPRRAQRLMDITYEALMRAIDLVSPEATLGDIGHAIQTYAQSHGYSVVRDYCGHGIGRIFHGPPTVLHFGKKGTGLRLAPGMFFTIEPMINLGTPETKVLADGWTVVTRDRQLSAQYEHTVAVTASGCEIFTLP